MRTGERVELLFASRKGNADQAATVAPGSSAIRSGLSGKVKTGRGIEASPAG
jgi:hypothetical protein